MEELFNVTVRLVWPEEHLLDISAVDAVDIFLCVIISLIAPPVLYRFPYRQSTLGKFTSCSRYLVFGGALLDLYFYLKIATYKHVLFHYLLRC